MGVVSNLDWAGMIGERLDGESRPTARWGQWGLNLESENSGLPQGPTRS